MRKLLTLVLTLATSMLPTHALDADADFVDYMENLERLEMERERIHQMLEAHEEWRQTTWGGFAVRQIQAIGKHFAPFFLAVGDAMNEERSGPTQILVLILLRSIVIATIVAAIYAIGQIATMILGREIIVEEKIVVEDSPEHGGTRKSEKRRGAREKKKEK